MKKVQRGCANELSRNPAVSTERWLTLLTEVIPLIGKEHSSCFDRLTCAADRPDHASLLQSCTNDPFASTLNGAATDLIAFGPELRIAHAVSVVSKIGDRLGQGMVFSISMVMGLECQEHFIHLSLPQLRETLFRPGPS